MLLTTKTVGVIQHDPTQAFEGYNLLHPSNSNMTWLLNNDGEVVHSWESNYFPMSAYLLEDGSLIRLARLRNTESTMNAGGAAGRLERFNWDGDLIWTYDIYDTTGMEGDYRSHHDFEVLPNGNVLMIAWERLSEDTAIQMGRDPGTFDDPSQGLWPETVFEIEPNLTAGSGGDVVWEWHVKDHLIQDFDSTKENFGVVADHPELIDINYFVTGTGETAGFADWNHANAVDYSEELDQIVISLRSQSEFWIIDHSTTTAEAATHSGGNSGIGGDLLYRWGNEAAYQKGTRADQNLFFQHDSQFIQDGSGSIGNILVFNNGWNRPDGSGGFVDFSSAEEIELPLVDQQWHLAQEMDGSMGDVASFGTHPAPADWQPISGDWNGDGIDTTGAFDSSTGTFYLNDANANGDSSVFVWMSPISGADLIAVAGDWNGDGIDSVGLLATTTGTFTLFNSTNGADAISVLLRDPGIATAIPLAGDWDGDGFDTIALYDSAHAKFSYTNRVVINDVSAWSSLSRSDVTFDRIPVAGDWDGDGADSLGWYNAATGMLQFGNDLSDPTEAITTYTFETAESLWRPVSGDWNNDGISTLGLHDPEYGSYRLESDGTYGPDEPVWRYDLEPELFSSVVSGVQRLPNGNTLITAGPSGSIIEVNSSGEIVWKYVNPVFGRDRFVHQGDDAPLLVVQANVGNGQSIGIRRNIVFRFTRYSPDYSAFDGRDLTPSDVLELTAPDILVEVDGQGNLTLTDVFPGGTANVVSMAFDADAHEFVISSPLHDLGNGVDPTTTEVRVPASSVTGTINIDLGAGDDVFDASGLSVSVNVLGGDGDDIIAGSMVADAIDAGTGDDNVSGLGGNDLLDGGDGNDTIRGAAGRDSIAGGAGDDLLRGQGGHDELSGGPGIDELDGGSGVTAVEDEVAGRVVITAAGYASERGDVARVIARSYRLTGSGLADRIDASASPIAVTVLGGEGDDVLIGSDYEDVLLGGDGDDVIDGRGGDDIRLAGDAGDDAIRGGSGNDRITGHAGDDTLLGSDGNDTLFGGAGRDVLLGESGDDRIRGHSGADILTGAGNGTALESDTLITEPADAIDDAFAFNFDALLI